MHEQFAPAFGGTSIAKHKRPETQLRMNDSSFCPVVITKQSFESLRKTTSVKNTFLSTPNDLLFSIRFHALNKLAIFFSIRRYLLPSASLQLFLAAI